MLALLLLSILLECLLYFVPFLWRRRRYAVGLPLTLMAFGTAALLFERPGILAIGVALVSGFRIINCLRIAEGRMHEQYLLRAARRTSFVLGSLQVLLLAAIYLKISTPVSMFSLLAAAELLTAVLILIVTIRNIVKTRHIPVAEHFADKELPTVTVAVPARNETTELEECLRAILASNYPKLEVLVLDDCSQDNTPEIIRGFAHDGVRFIKGVEPEERWLAKNQAYDRLADEANGDLIVFCGVDVRFGPEAIRALVTTLMERKKDMVSVMPRRLQGGSAAAIIQPMRYWWELALPRRYFNRPPVLSTCWIIKRKILKKLGGLDAVQHAIIPEGYFARELVKTDAYSFIRADDILDIQTRKSQADQQETAIRMRYPQIRRRLEWALVLSVGELLLLVGPFVVLLSLLWAGFGISQAMAAVAGILLILTHVLIVYVSNPSAVPIALVNFPLVVLTEVLLALTSMIRYEFSTVDWKGRNVCIPVMHVYPHLPKMP